MAIIIWLNAGLHLQLALAYHGHWLISLPELCETAGVHRFHNRAAIRHAYKCANSTDFDLRLER